jgi:hypothetical protein
VLAEIVAVPPANLRIDEENPRISQPNIGQNKALQALAAHLGSKLHALAADIVEYGIDPSSLMIVMESPSETARYIVLDGNRRLAAIRALEYPESVKDAVESSVLRKLRKLSQEYQDDPLESVPAVVVKDRAEAHHWIELGHTGEFGGAAKLRWGADESARFRARSGTPEPHTQVLDFLERRGDLTAELRRDIPTSSFKRLIESPAVRSRLGWELRNKVLYLVADEVVVAKANMYVLRDLAPGGGTSVEDIYTKEKRQKYADDLPGDVVVKPTVKSGQGVPITSAGFRGGSSGAAKPTGKKGGNRIGRKRDRLIPSDCVLNIPSSSQRLREMERELRKLSLENHTNAISVLVRVFLELSIDTYLLKNVPSVHERNKLAKKMEAAKDDLLRRQKLTAKQAKPVEKAVSGGTFLAASIATMHEYVHNAHMFPEPSDLRSAWDSLQPFVTALWSP